MKKSTETKINKLLKQHVKEIKNLLEADSIPPKPKVDTWVLIRIRVKSQHCKKVKRFIDQLK